MKAQSLLLLSILPLIGCENQKPATGGTTAEATASASSAASSAATTPAAKTSAPPKIEQTTGRIGVNQPYTLGTMRVTLRKVSVGKVPLKETDGTLKYSDQPCLMFAVRLENLSDKRMAKYESWVPDLEAARSVGKLVDDTGKEYKRVTFGFGNNVKDRTITDDIYAKKSANDLLVFEAPPAGVKYLELDLPGANCGQRGVFQFKIEAKDIGKQ